MTLLLLLNTHVDASSYADGGDNIACWKAKNMVSKNEGKCVRVESYHALAPRMITSSPDELNEGITMDPCFFVGVAARLIGLASFVGMAYFLLLNKKQQSSTKPSYEKTKVVESTHVFGTVRASQLNGSNNFIMTTIISLLLFSFKTTNGLPCNAKDIELSNAVNDFRESKGIRVSYFF